MKIIAFAVWLITIVGSVALQIESTRLRAASTELVKVNEALRAQLYACRE